MAGMTAAMLAESFEKKRVACLYFYILMSVGYVK